MLKDEMRFLIILLCGLLGNDFVNLSKSCSSKFSPNASKAVLKNGSII
jgi:hypothetical protein